MTFTAIICSSCYALSFPHPLLPCWREFLLFGGQPPTPVHVSRLLSPPHLPSVVVWVSTWLAMYNERIMDETQRSFAGILRLLYMVAWTHHGPKSFFTYLGLIITGAPSPGYAPAGYPPCNCSGQGPRKGREQARRAPSSPPERAPTRHCVNAVQEAWLPLISRCGIRTRFWAAFTAAPTLQPEQPRQFSAFRISGPISMFNYSYNTAVI